MVKEGESNINVAWRKSETRAEKECQFFHVGFKDKLNQSSLI